MTVIRPAVEMTVVELRNYAQSLGIKNVKNYKKEDLLKEVDNRLSTPITTECVFDTENGVEDVCTKEFSYDLSKTMIENIECYYKVTRDMSLTKEELAELFFEKAEEEGFFIENGDIENFYQTYASFKNDEIEYKENNDRQKTVKKQIKKTYMHKEKPELGTQSRTIYDTILQHPSWSHYKIAFVLKCTYTNVRRVFKYYIEGRDIEGYKDSRSQDCFKRLKHI